MKKQNGLFLYETLHYGKNSIYGENLEDFIKVIGNKNNPILIKAHISKKHLIRILKNLKTLGITANTLYGDEFGVAEDAYNSYFYNENNILNIIISQNSKRKRWLV